MFVKIREVCYIRRETNFSYTVGQVCLEYERMIHQGNRSDLTGNHLGITAEQVGRKFNVSGRTVSRYIRLMLRCQICFMIMHQMTLWLFMVSVYV